MIDAYDPRVNLLLAVTWVAAGAVAIGLSTALLGRQRLGRIPMMGWFFCLSALFVSCLWLVLPITAVSTTIDNARPTEVQCGSAWGALNSSPYVDTDTGPQLDPSHGPCQAAAWHRVASLGTAELGLAALLLGAGSSLLTGPSTRGSARAADPS